MITENIIGPFSIFFTNQNTQMGLAGHSHFATVRLRYLAASSANGKDMAFPSFENTHKDVQDELKEFCAKPFKDHTNEDVARALFKHFLGWTTDTITKWGGDYRLVRVELSVQGVPDRIGHANGMTVYEVSA
jgi:hypothetical protein